MDIKALQILVAIADHHSFQLAAHVLGMSISNVSLQVQNLESHIGVALFDRSTRPPTLTDAGAETVADARALLRQWERLGQKAVDRENSGRLKIGAVHTAVAGGVSVALGQLKRQEPNLFLQLNTALTPELILQLQQGTIDCAIVTEPTTPVLETRFIPIASEELGVIAHRSATGSDFRSVLESNPYLRFNRKATLAQQIDQALKARNVKVNTAMEITTLDAIESLVKNKLGVSVVPIGRYVRKLPAGIQSIPFEEPSERRQLGLLVREQSPRMHLVNLLEKALVKAYRPTQ
ncbi:MAG: LysR family transcriptional regulator [Granulosicoccus sp.]|nr:LysR family transcriptional regulator [Granulosicoccus sp.]